MRCVRYNIRSVNNKFDDVMFLNHQLTVLALTETCRDADSPVFGRCRASGYSVVDHPHLRIRDDQLSVNHGGVVLVAAPATSLSPLSTGPSSSTFDVVDSYVHGRLSSSSTVLVASQLFDDLSALLERLLVLGVPLFIIGDFNVTLDRDVRLNS